MKIEPGKFYRCRDGSKARIYAVDGRAAMPIHGATYGVEWTSCDWRKNGLFNSGGTASDYDLISEWTDPKPRLRAFVDHLGQVRLADCDNFPEMWTSVPWLDQPEEK